MPMAQPNEPNNNMEQHICETMNTLIREQVIHTIGEPHGLHKVEVRRVWEDHYRVNIHIGADAASARIANSYFVAADSGANIVMSNPELMRLY